MNLQEKLYNTVYPDTQCYDIHTLKPSNESTRKRLEYLDTYFRDIFKGESFLDIGTGKCLLPLHFRKKFNKIVAIEKDKSFYDICEGVSEYHNVDNIEIFHSDFRNFNAFDRNNEVKFDVVFAGNIHHYFYNDAIRINANPWLWLYKMASMVNKYLILDGPLTVNDPAVQILIKENNWSNKNIVEYCIDTLENKLNSVGFILDSIELNQGGVRYTIIFKKFSDYFTQLKYDKASLIMGEDISCNHRKPYSVVKFNGYKYKIHNPSMNDNTLFVINQLSDYINPIKYLLVDNEKKVGHVAKWLNGSLVDFPELLDNWLKFNNHLSTIGLIEPGFTKEDFIKIDNKILDIDIDMIKHISEYDDNYFDDNGNKVDYFKGIWSKKLQWITSIDKEVINYVAENFRKEDCFYNLMKRGSK